MTSERTGLFQLPLDPSKAARELARRPVDSLLTGGLDTDDTGRIMVKHDDTLEVTAAGELTVSNRDSYLFNVAYGGY